MRVLVQVVGEVLVEAGADVAVDGLQLDEDERQAVDEAHEVGAAVVVRGTRRPVSLSSRTARKRLCGVPGGAAFWKSITRARAGAALALRVFVAHRHTVADKAVELLVVLEERAAKSTRVSFSTACPRASGQLGIEPPARRAGRGRARPPARSVRPSVPARAKRLLPCA
jgi:hypothetical protein